MTVTCAGLVSAWLEKGIGSRYILQVEPMRLSSRLIQGMQHTGLQVVR